MCLPAIQFPLFATTSKLQNISFTHDKYNVYAKQVRNNNNIITKKLLQKTLITATSRHLGAQINKSVAKISHTKRKVTFAGDTRMTTSKRRSSGPMLTNKGGLNVCYELHSHGKNMKNKKVSDRLNKLLQYNVLYDLQEGTYPTPGQLIMPTGFGRPSKNQSFTSEVQFDHVVLPLIKSGYLDAAHLVTLAKTSKLYAHLMITMERV